jgi:hypothetical protein
MPAKGYIKWEPYDYQGRDSQTKSQSEEAIKYLKRMGFPTSSIRVMKRNDKHYVYYKADIVGSVSHWRRKSYIPYRKG